MNNLCELFQEVPKQIQINSSNIKILENNLKFLENKNSNVRRIDDQINKRLNGIEEKMKDMNILGMFKGLSGDDGDNANIVKFLISLGFNSNKTFNFYPNFDISWDYIRGCFEGDGYIRHGEINIVGASKNHMKLLYDFIKSYNLSSKSFKHI